MIIQRLNYIFTKNKEMLAIEGRFENGKIVLKEEVESIKSVKVIVTFLDEDVSIKSKKHPFAYDFSRSRNLLKDFKGEFSSTVVEERREGR
jgi:hypothetical protein